MLKKHLMVSLMLAGVAFAQTRGAVGWFHPSTPQDRDTAALISHDVAVNFGLLKPHQTQVFTAPLLTPQGPQLPLEVLYREGLVAPTLPEHLALLQEALGLRTLIGGVVKGNEVTLMVRQGNQHQEVKVQSADNLRVATLKKVAELLKTSLVVPRTSPSALATPLRHLQQLDLASAIESHKTTTDPVVKAFLETLTAPRNTLDRAYQAILQGPKNLLDLNVSEVPSLVAYQALYHEQTGNIGEALNLLDASTYPYAKTLFDVIQLTQGEPLPANWPASQRGILTDAQALVLRSMGVNVQDTRERLYQSLPNSEFVLREYSSLVFDRNAYPEARKVMERLVGMDPSSALYWTNLGWAQYKTGSVQQALQSTLRSLQLDPQDQVAAYNLGLYHVVLGQELAAQEAYDRALQLGTYKDTLMALKDLEELKLERANHYKGVLYAQLGNYPTAVKHLQQYLQSSPGAAAEQNTRNMLERLEQARCDFELSGAPWFTVKGRPLGEVKQGEVKQGEFLHSSFNVRCSASLPLPVTVKYTLSQNGQVLSAAEVTPDLQPATQGFRVSDLLVPLVEVQDGPLTSEIQVTGANGATRTFTQTLTVKGKASLKERLESANLQLVDGYRNSVVQEDPVQDLMGQVQEVVQSPERMVLMYPDLTDAQIAALQPVTPEKVIRALERLLALVGGELPPGSEVYFPDEYILMVLQEQAATAPAAP